MWHLTSHWLGLDDPGGPIYLFYSGSGSFILKGSIIVVAWHWLNCHVDGCWRIGGHRNPQTGFRSCRRHRNMQVAK